jgi:hypothetical protein
MHGHGHCADARSGTGMGGSIRARVGPEEELYQLLPKWLQCEDCRQQPVLGLEDSRVVEDGDEDCRGCVWAQTRVCQQHACVPAARVDGCVRARRTTYRQQGHEGVREELDDGDLPPVAPLRLLVVRGVVGKGVLFGKVVLGTAMQTWCSAASQLGGKGLRNSNGGQAPRCHRVKLSQVTSRQGKARQGKSSQLKRTSSQSSS